MTDFPPLTFINDDPVRLTKRGDTEEWSVPAGVVGITFHADGRIRASFNDLDFIYRAVDLDLARQVAFNWVRAVLQGAK